MIILKTETIGKIKYVGGKDMSKFCNEEVKNSILNSLINDVELVTGQSQTALADNLKAMFNKTLENAGIFNNRKLEDMNDYISYTLWSRDDIYGELVELGYDASEENIDAVINSGLLKDLGNCLDEQWEEIHYAIKETLGEAEAILEER